MAAAGRVVNAAAALLLILSAANAEDNATAKTDDFMKRLEGARLISGILGIQKSGRLVYERAFGKAVVVSIFPFIDPILMIIGQSVVICRGVGDIW